MSDQALLAFIKDVTGYVESLHGERLYDFLELSVQLQEGKEITEIDPALVHKLPARYLVRLKTKGDGWSPAMFRLGFVSQEHPVHGVSLYNPNHHFRLNLRLLPNDGRPQLLGKDPISFTVTETATPYDLEGQCRVRRSHFTGLQFVDGAVTEQSLVKLMRQIVLNSNLGRELTVELSIELTKRYPTRYDAISWPDFVNALEKGASVEEICSVSKLSDLDPSKSPEELLDIVRKQLFKLLVFPAGCVYRLWPDVLLCDSSLFVALAYSCFAHTTHWTSARRLRSNVLSVLQRVMQDVEQVFLLSPVIGTITTATQVRPSQALVLNLRRSEPWLDVHPKLELF